MITSTDGARVEVLPEPLAGLELLEASVGWFVPGERVPVGVTWDRRSGLVTCAFRVTGDGQFEIADPRDPGAPPRRVGGDARDVRPGGIPGQPDRVARLDITGVGHRADRRPARALGRRRADAAATGLPGLIEAVSPAVVNHEVLVTISVDSARVGSGREIGSHDGRRSRALLGEAQALRTQLAEAGLMVDAVLTASELVTASRVRSDPSVVDRIGLLRRSLAARAGRSAPSFGPMLVDEHVDAVQVDEAWHRSWHVAGWPRRDVPAAWLNPLMTVGGLHEVDHDGVRTGRTVGLRRRGRRRDVEAGSQHRVAAPQRGSDPERRREGARRRRQPRAGADPGLRRDGLRRAGHDDGANTERRSLPADRRWS